jgi:asparagine synthetase B (glutamine-hydrolysing)
MVDMSNSVARHFGITNHRPYQDNKELDGFMRNLPLKAKIHKVEYGKYALRKIAEKYLPKNIAWRKKKVGGPVYPVNLKKGWLENGEFNKEKYIEYQNEILCNSDSV